MNNKINRVEVIDHSKDANPFGRAFTKYDCQNVEIQLQDDDRTLKVFIS